MWPWLTSKLIILLPLPPKCWGYRYALLCPAGLALFIVAYYYLLRREFSVESATFVNNLVTRAGVGAW
jgi:hypothetical protein